MNGQYSDLAEHVSIIVALLMSFASMVGLLFWWSFSRFANKVEKLMDAHAKCQALLPEKYVSLKEFIKHEEDVWQAINHHAHSMDGRVIR